MVEYIDNILCIEGGFLYNIANIMSKSTYDKLTRLDKQLVRRRGCKGTPSLLDWERLPMRFRLPIIEKYGNPYELNKTNPLEKFIEPDPQAAAYYSTFKLENGNNLPIGKQIEYRTNSEILNAIHKMMVKQKLRKSVTGGRLGNMWSKASEHVNSLDTKRYKFNLPTHWRKLKDSKYKPFAEHGYSALVHKGYGNDNSRKVNDILESLIVSLACLPNKPFNTGEAGVLEYYYQFIGRSIDIVDIKTGEMFEPSDFTNKGVPITISESTVWNYINDPKNKLIIERQRHGAHDFNLSHKPHHHRHLPVFSGSKITLDDRDINHTVMPNGKRVKAYYSFDVMSGAIIGFSHSADKDAQLYINCIKSMFQFLDNNDLGIPMEMEVEHHLVNNFKDGLMKAEVVFPFVRWCNAGNSQEKYAERLIGIKKYSTEKRNNGNVGRHYSKLSSNRVVLKKIYDAENDNYKEAKASLEEIIANDVAEINEYNNTLHKNQEKYPGMTRIEVFLNHANPDMSKISKPNLVKYIGDKTQTSIRRNMYVTVQYQKYQLSSSDVVKNLKPNNNKVEAYYLHDEDWTIGKVYLFQGDQYIDTCEPVEQYNQARAEWTDEDAVKIENQREYIKSFDESLKTDTAEKYQKIQIIKNTDYKEEVVPVLVIDEPMEDPANEFEELMRIHNETRLERKQRAIENI